MGGDEDVDVDVGRCVVVEGDVLVERELLIVLI